MSIKNNYMYLHCNFISTKIHCANHKYILKTIECPWFKIWKWKQKPSDKSAPHKLNDYVVFLGNPSHSCFDSFMYWTSPREMITTFW